MSVALTEISDLTQRIDLIQYYEMRALMVEVHGTMSKSYVINIKLGKQLLTTSTTG